MKKIYTQPEWKVAILKAEDVITESLGYGTLDDEAEPWEW